MNIYIILSLIIASLCIAISDIYKNKSVAISGPMGTLLFTETTLVVLSLFLIIFLVISNKNIGPLYIPTSKNIFSSLKYNFISAIGLFIGLLLINIAFYYNNHSTQPLNLGILTAILSFSFIFTIIINIIHNYIDKKPVIIPILEIIGCLSIILGVICITYSQNR